MKESRRSSRIVSWTNNKGQQIPGIDLGDRTQWLISKHNPEREAQRLVGDAGSATIGLVFGWGNGFLAKELEKVLDTVIVLEPSCMKHFWETIPSGGKISFHWIGETATIPEEMLLICSRYSLSLLSASLGFWTLPGYNSAFPGLFASIRQGCTDFLSYASQDLGLQAKLGETWFENTLQNMVQWKEKIWLFEDREIQPNQSILCLGAGPSGSKGIDLLLKERPMYYLLAADTLYPALWNLGIEPDIVFSLDAQWYSLLHIMGTGSIQQKWMVDAAIHPGLLRLLPRANPRFSDHPLNALFHFHGLPVMSLPSYRNVGEWILHYGTTLSDYAQKRIITFGIDNSYPNYRSYVPGTYLDTWTNTYSSRYLPRESWELSILSRGDTSKLMLTPTGYTHKDFSATAQISQPYPFNGFKSMKNLDWQGVVSKTARYMKEQLNESCGPSGTWHTKPWIAALYPQALGLMKREKITSIEKSMELTRKKTLEKMNVSPIFEL